MDLLLQRALDFEKITHYKYKYTMGRKGKLYIFEVDFRYSDFHHLIGLQKLTDLDYLQTKRKILFKRILSGEITHDNLKNSVHYSEMCDRFDAFDKFAKLFNDKNTTYKYTQDLRYSQIPADYLLTNDTYGTLLYIFVTKRDNEDLYCCESFFPFDQLKYEYGQTKLTMLKVERCNVDTDETEVIFCNENYKE